MNKWRNYLWNRYHIHFIYCSLEKELCTFVYSFNDFIFRNVWKYKKVLRSFSCHDMYINHSKARMLQIVKNGTWISENNYMLLSLCSCWFYKFYIHDYLSVNEHITSVSSPTGTYESDSHVIVIIDANIYIERLFTAVLIPEI